MVAVLPLLEEYGAAFEADDGDAVLALMTADAIVKAGDGTSLSGDNLKDSVDNLGEFTSDRIGDPLITERPGFWMVAQAGLVDFAGRSFANMDLHKIVERDGSFLIQYHETWRGTP